MRQPRVASNILIDDIEAICFDLDDTLWPIGPVIEHAEACTHAWLAQHYPKITDTYSIDAMRVTREQIAEEYPDHQYDVTFLRKAVLAKHAAEAGYSDQLVEAAFEIFIAARHEVSLFADVVPALLRLRERYRLIGVTNGNADLTIIGLDHLIEHTITARAVGAAKPHPAVFEAAVTHLATAPERVLHVGDDPLVDVAGARAAGLRCVWINRNGQTWPATHERPDAEIQTLDDLETLLGPGEPWQP